MNQHYAIDVKKIDKNGLIFEVLGLVDGPKWILFDVQNCSTAMRRPNKAMQKRFDLAMPYLMAYRTGCLIKGPTSRQRQRTLVAWSMARAILDGDLTSTVPSPERGN
ncbi:hypothetical protein Lumi_079 [Xylophilus phage Lumi]|nr:hypothetical protein Lumi_079 [Xylophilus phage Lumi]